MTEDQKECLESVKTHLKTANWLICGLANSVEDFCNEDLLVEAHNDVACVIKRLTNLAGE